MFYRCFNKIIFITRKVLWNISNNCTFWHILLNETLFYYLFLSFSAEVSLKIYNLSNALSARTLLWLSKYSDFWKIGENFLKRLIYSHNKCIVIKSFKWTFSPLSILLSAHFTSVVLSKWVTVDFQSMITALKNYFFFIFCWNIFKNL